MAGEEYSQLSEALIGAAIRVHSELGPGLLEKIYEVCLCHELGNRGIRFQRPIALPVEYDGVKLDSGLRLDLVVENAIVVELKAVDDLLPIHTAQLVSYLKLGRYPLGYLFNFHSVRLKQGIKRVINKTWVSSEPSGSSV